MTYFVILGLPRSGTTYLQTLLNSDPRIQCRGESFDPWQIDDDGQKINDFDRLVARDANPAAFFDERLSLRKWGTKDALEAVGIKVLFQHNPRLLSDILPSRPDLKLIFVHRANKLAQFASMRHTEITGEWTRTGAGQPAPKLKAHVHWLTSQCNELANKDFLLGHWLQTLPNQLLTVEYRDMFAPGFDRRVLEHLGLPPGAGLSSPLRKQGNNTVVERYENADEIADYLTRVGKANWLGPELQA
ncbi:LPS sulfotransferase NodH [Aliiruegeria haliotis]|uniref:LPS sulfotransferase NodH n=1 Tax=Aliiruegeria haliotis TaxID=1280846 RepID=A0A2T0RUX1_9RHOB|nr:sulfotransferase [Aliiruegeria haliotis]PRY24947.1 LPS sulfotransferase NodH [Aliiruegeria haliotis]